MVGDISPPFGHPRVGPPTAAPLDDMRSEDEKMSKWLKVAVFAALLMGDRLVRRAASSWPA